MNDSGEPQPNPNPIASEQPKTEEQQQIPRHGANRESILRLIDRLRIKDPETENPKNE